MSDENEDQLSEMLADGWEIAGYTVNMLAAGAQHYNILPRKGTNLTNFGILWSGQSELARVATVITPYVKPPAKKGFFG